MLKLTQEKQVLNKNEYSQLFHLENNSASLTLTNACDIEFPNLKTIN